MGDNKQIAVALALTPDPSLLPLVRLLVGRLARQMNFSEAQRFNLQQGVTQVCGRMMELGSQDGWEMRLEFAGFADRLEVVVEDELEMEEAEAYLLNQLLDRVVVEATPGGRTRLTLVQYVSELESQP